MLPLRALSLALATLLSVPAVSAEPIRFETARGPMDLSGRPDRIVALDVAAVDTLTALGRVPDGIVWPLHVDYLPAQVTGAARVGTLFEPDFEAIAALGPQVILVGARGVAQARPLSRIAPVADMSIGPDAPAETLARLRAYGTLLGREAEAQAQAVALEARIAEVRVMVAEKGGKALILMTNGPKLSVFGPDSRFGWLHATLGFGLAQEGISEQPHGEAVSFEYIAEADPDTLIVIDRGAAVGAGNAAAQATLDNPLVQGTRAAREGRVIYLSPAEVYIAAGGVQAMTRTLDEIAAALGAM